MYTAEKNYSCGPLFPITGLERRGVGGSSALKNGEGRVRSVVREVFSVKPLQNITVVAVRLRSMYP